ncbi:MAG: DUF91 domain-containing protein [Gammaproteobacteria bacterium AqS3]|nr:DUF91 domain-containing protein [Gammaproteobacteria bacterium AqS3]
MSEIKLFVATSMVVQEIPGRTANLERDIQTLFEKHLETFLGIRFVCSEFSIGGGRIDTLGLDARNNPVIIEYKRNMTSHSISQGLSYMDWLVEHKNDFYVEVLRRMDQNTADRIKWSAPRLICVAADFGRYDIRAANRVDNVELIKYKKYGGELVLLEFMNQSSSSSSSSSSSNDSARIERVKTEPEHTVREERIGRQERTGRSPSGKKPTKQKRHAQYVEEMEPEQAKRFQQLEYFLQSLGRDVKQARRLNYETFARERKGFASLQLINKRNQIYVWLYLDPKQDVSRLEEGFTVDMTDKNHWGGGDLQVIISSDVDIERAKPLIQKAYDKAYRF